VKHIIITTNFHNFSLPGDVLLVDLDIAPLLNSEISAWYGVVLKQEFFFMDS